jgi:hypothetical protein
MAHRIFITVVAITLMSGLLTFASATGIPDATECSASRIYTGPETTVMFNIPNGDGSFFSTCGIIFDDGTVSTVDSTIEVVVRDASGVGIANYPSEDIWLESADGGLTPCTEGAIADFSTDVNGYTEFENPLEAGGWSEGQTYVVVNGNGMGHAPLDIAHNSADINGDLVVNLVDVSLFANDFFSGYQFRSDFIYDEVINLLDVTKMAQSMGASCP